MEQPPSQTVLCPIEGKRSSVYASVIVATYNRATGLGATLKTLLSQETTFPYEVIVVDNKSTDATKAVTMSLASSTPQLRYVYAAEQGAARARNAGVTAARGTMLVFADDDVTAPPNWLAALLQTYETHKDAWCVGGRIVLEMPTEGVPEWFDEPLAFCLSGLDMGPDVIRREYPEDVWSANLSVKREALQRVGLFHPTLGPQGNQMMYAEDSEMCWRIQRAGGTVYYCGAAMLRHRVPASRLSKAFFRRRAYWIGRAYGLLRVRERDYSWHNLLPRLLRVSKTWLKSRLPLPRPDEARALQDEVSLWISLGFAHQRWLRQRLDAAPALEESSAKPAASGTSSSPTGGQ
jgi:GT2 family glycosyltransferase